MARHITRREFYVRELTKKNVLRVYRLEQGRLAPIENSLTLLVGAYSLCNVVTEHLMCGKRACLTALRAAAADTDATTCRESFNHTRMPASDWQRSSTSAKRYRRMSKMPREVGARMRMIPTPSAMGPSRPRNREGLPCHAPYNWVPRPTAQHWRRPRHPHWARQQTSS
eukprot:scaffold5611_cov132-Isochrysis_galbana.AAC.2